MRFTERVKALFGRTDPIEAHNREVLAEISQLRQAYDAAKVDNEWQRVGENGTAETINAPDRERLMLRARSLERNSDVANALLGAYVRNVVGNRLDPQFKNYLADGTTPNDKLNQQLADAWWNWSETAECDVTKTQTFSEMLDMVVIRKLVDGEILAKKALVRDRKIPLALQIIEADDIDSSVFGKKDQNIVSGVEVDKTWKPIAYYIKTDDNKSVTVPASEMIHLFKKTRPRQVRGVSEFAPVARKIRDLTEYQEAELISAKIRSLIAMIITTNDPAAIAGSFRSTATKPGESIVTDSTGKPIKQIGRGAIHVLPPGSKMETIGGKGETSNVKEFTQTCIRQIGAALGLSYEAVSRDMSASTYSSARQNSLEDRQTWKTLQGYIIRHFCQPVMEAWMDAVVLSGVVNIPDYEANREKYLNAIDWVAQGWSWIDPKTDVTTSLMEMRSGMDTLEKICAEKGLDWKEVLKQRKREEDYAKSLGLELDLTNGGVQNAAADGNDPQGAKNGPE